MSVNNTQSSALGRFFNDLETDYALVMASENEAVQLVASKKLGNVAKADAKAKEADDAAKHDTTRKGLDKAWNRTATWARGRFQQLRARVKVVNTAGKVITDPQEVAAAAQAKAQKTLALRVGAIALIVLAVIAALAMLCVLVPFSFSAILLAGVTVVCGLAAHDMIKMAGNIHESEKTVEQVPWDKKVERTILFKALLNLYRKCDGTSSKKI